MHFLTIERTPGGDLMQGNGLTRRRFRLKMIPAQFERLAALLFVKTEQAFRGRVSTHHFAGQAVKNHPIRNRGNGGIELGGALLNGG